MVDSPLMCYPTGMKELLIALGFVDNGSNIFLLDTVDGYHYDVDFDTYMIYKIRLSDYSTVYAGDFHTLPTFVTSLGLALVREG